MAKHRARPSGRGPRTGTGWWRDAGEGTATALKILYYLVMLVSTLTGSTGGGLT